MKNIMTNKKHWIILIFVWIYAISFSNDQEINLEISDDKISLNESINLKLELINLDDADDVKLYGIDKFNILNRSTSNYTSIENSKKTVKKSINYIIQPQTEGNFFLEAKFSKDGKEMQTKKLKIEVSNKYDNEPKTNKSLDIETNISSEKLYFGEKLVFTNSLYRRVNIDGKGFIQERNFDDFIVKDVDKLDSKTQYDSNGRAIAITEDIEKKILKPIRTGEIEIPSYNYQVNVVTSRDGFFSNSEPRYLKTESKLIEVLPLPQPVPNNFSEIIGNPKISQKHSNLDIEYGDAVTLNVIIEGNVVLDNLNHLVQDKLNNFQIYESIKNELETVKDGKYYTKKEFEIIVIPKKQGLVKFPEIEIPYFDSNETKYKTLEIEPFEINVKKSAINNFENGNIDNELKEVNINQITEEEMNDKYFIVKIRKIYVFLIGYVIIIGAIIFLIYILYKKLSKRDEYKIIYKKYKKAKNREEYLDVVNEMVKYYYGIGIKSSSLNTIRQKIDNDELFQIIQEILQKYELGEEINWKSKIKNIYNTTFAVQNTVLT